MWEIDFITEEQFEEHVKSIVKKYKEKLKGYNLRKFNKNVIDPIKMTFDKALFNKSWEQIVASEIFRQQDKSTTNSIGYFHQNMFKHIDKCTVPKKGWDVIVDMPYTIDGNSASKIYVEMKNKHNTMNSSSASDIYKKMQKQLLADDDCFCFLVEIISSQHQNVKWHTVVDGEPQEHTRIRKVSIDEFYRIVTGDDKAFYKICMALPEYIDKIVDNTEVETPEDTVMEELTVKSSQYGDDDAAKRMALYKMAFDSYDGFKDVPEQITIFD